MAPLRKQDLLARTALIALLALCAWAVSRHVGVASDDQAGIRMVLPDRVAGWTGEDIFFCSSRTCGHRFYGRQLPALPPAACPDCGSPLSQMNWAERDMLPADTELIRKFYVPSDPRTPPLNVSIVLSGDDRSSIHRPEVCQTAAGNSIVKREIIRVPLENGSFLDVMVMDMVLPPDPAASRPAYHTFYAYWFVGKDRTTASHWQRMWWMAWDRIFRGVSHRWAYIAVHGPRNPADESHLQVAARFAAALQPRLLLDSPAAP